jgi:hypothetical protein
VSSQHTLGSSITCCFLVITQGRRPTCALLKRVLAFGVDVQWSGSTCAVGAQAPRHVAFPSV